MVDQRFPAHYRLQHNLDFQRVFQRKRTVSNAWLILYGCENGLPYCRLGLTVSRRYGNAVARHRWKRLVREAFRCQREELPGGFDLVVLPRPGQSLDFHNLIRIWPDLLRRLAKRLEFQGGTR